MNSNEIEDMSITIKMFGRQYTISLIFRLRENAGSACIRWFLRIFQTMYFSRFM